MRSHPLNWSRSCMLFPRGRGRKHTKYWHTRWPCCTSFVYFYVYLPLFFCYLFYKIARNLCVQSVQQLPIIVGSLGIRVQWPAHPSQLCRLRKFELNSREKCVRTNSLGADIRYSTVPGRIVPQAICPYPDE